MAPALAALALVAAACRAPALPTRRAPAEPGVGPAASAGVTLELRLSAGSERSATQADSPRRVSAVAAPASYRISVAAADLASPMVATTSAGADAATIRLQGVPGGGNRLITVSGLDGAGRELPGGEWMGVASLLSAAHRLTLTPATTAVGKVWERWLGAGQLTLAGSASPSAVLSRLDAIRSGGSLAHFRLVDATAWADAAAAAGSLEVGGSFAIPAATVDVTVANAPEDVPADLWLDDPISPPQYGVSHLSSQTYGRYRIAPVLPGTWSAWVTVPGLGTASRSFQVEPGGSASVALGFPGWTAGPPLPAAVGNSAVVSDASAVFVLGGVVKGGGATDSCWVLDAGAASPGWQALPALPRAREGARAAILGNNLYVVGGMDRGVANWDAYALDLGTRTAWNTVTAPSIVTSGRVGCCVNFPALPTGLYARSGKLYLLYVVEVGQQPPYLAARAKVFDPASPGNGWPDAAEVPAGRTPRLNVAFSMFQGRPVLAGGDRGTAFEGLANKLQVPDFWQGVATVEELDPTLPRWAALPDLRQVRSELALAEADGRLFAAGGVDAGLHAQKTVDRYDPATRTWLPVPPLLEPRSAFGLVYAGGKLWAVGGAPSRWVNAIRGGQAVVLASVETLDPGGLP